MWRRLQNCPPSVDLEELLRHLMAQNVKSIRGRIVIDSSMKYIFFLFHFFFFFLVYLKSLTWLRRWTNLIFGRNDTERYFIAVKSWVFQFLLYFKMWYKAHLSSSQSFTINRRYILLYWQPTHIETLKNSSSPINSHLSKVA